MNRDGFHIEINFNYFFFLPPLLFAFAVLLVLAAFFLVGIFIYFRMVKLITKCKAKHKNLKVVNCQLLRKGDRFKNKYSAFLKSCKLETLTGKCRKIKPVKITKDF